MHNACVNASRYIYAQIYLATCFRCICIVVDMMRIICNELCKLLLESFLPCSWYASSERRSVLWCASSCCVWLIWWHKLHWRAEWNRTNVQSCCVKQHKVLFMPADLSATDMTCKVSWHVSRQKMLSKTCRQHKNISHHFFASATCWRPKFLSAVVSGQFVGRICCRQISHCEQHLRMADGCINRDKNICQY